MKFLILLLFTLEAAMAFDWQGHRGARGLYPENTIQGMKEALGYGVSTLEMDVVISKDEKVVVSHEPWMNPDICLSPEGKKVRDKEINLYKLTFEEIKKYDCGSKVHPRFPEQKKVKESKPLLVDLIRAIEEETKKSGVKKRYNIEIKSSPENERAGFQPDYVKFSDLVVASLSGIVDVDRVTIQSFDWRVLKYIQIKYPNVLLSALSEKAISPKELHSELKFWPTVFSPHYESVTASIVEGFHSQNVLVIPWTVNEVEDMKKLIGLRVDGLITDYPNLISSVPVDLYLTKASLCSEKENFFEGKCVKLPENAKASDSNPGWTCEEGFQQKWSSCVRIKVPKNGHLLPDGKSWECDEGYERYRHSCRKKKVKEQ